MAKVDRERGEPLERAIESVLRPGGYISYDDSYDFVTDLDQVACKVEDVALKEPQRAAGLYETFIAGCCEKAYEIDDSNGHFGMFVERLFFGWIKARVASGADADETADTLLDWMEKDEYGFCHGLELEAVKAFDKKGLLAFELRVQTRLADATAGKDREADALRRQRGEILRAIYAEQGNIEAYVGLCGKSGTAPKDCLAVARMLKAQGDPAEALSWVEKGFALDRKRSDGGMADLDLSKLKRELLTALGRGEEALAEAWAEFKKYPSDFAYQEFIRFVPKAERASWHEKAMEAAEEGDLGLALELWLGAREWGRIVRRLGTLKDMDFQALNHYRTRDVAEALAEKHPDLAAKIYRGMGMSILVRKKSRAYPAAHSHFEKAMACFERAGQTPVWEALVAEIRTEHRRKLGFMGGFEKLLAGRGPSTAPTFLERARSRWAKRGRSP